MVEPGRYLLDVMRDQHNGRTLRVDRYVGERRSEPFTRPQGETGQCLVKKENLRAGHQTAGDEYALLLPGRQGAVAAVGEVIDR